jgi:hypothetical protein
MTRKLSKIQGSSESQVDSNVDEAVSRLQTQNRELRRQNQTLSDNMAKRNSRKPASSRASRPSSTSKKRPASAKASSSKTSSWAPPADVSSGAAGFESKLRVILQVTLLPLALGWCCVL